MNAASLLWRSLGLGLASAALMAIWIARHGEIWNLRVTALVGIWFGGGFLGTWIAGGALAILTRWKQTRWPNRLRGFLFLIGFLMGGAFCFLIYTRIAAGEFPTGFRHFVMWSTFGSAENMVLFLFTAPLFLLPWMAPAMIIAGYLLLPGRPRVAKVEPRAGAV